MDVENKRRPITKYKQKIKEKMMMIKKRKQKISQKSKKPQVDLNQSTMNQEKMNPSEKQKNRLLSRFDTFKDKEDKQKYAIELQQLIESNNKDLIMKVTEEVERSQLNELVEEAIDQFVFGAANRKGTSNRTFSGIFLDIVKNHIEEEDPMKVKAIFQKSAKQQKKIMKEKEKSKVKTSQSNISVNANAKNRNMFADLSDSNQSDSDDEEDNKKTKNENKMEQDSDSEFESCDDEEMNE
ncbi:hypothetical protein TTHERM_00497180 (macronuclear) [Tetrahymena thermophila SB210]|uniref:Phosphorylated adapter RNA export protein RNA-binding domain-containing protein n=1 Tax=Tetrahymena thermophila (strain SB210) TaxID=312017 RepID=I7M4M2_TETTS|nr:hypothetical protein TTHERM_00497180 [Tetrahymena thermophila SB210]EAS07665.1 hypothetical protein TTHERM_00497180 [Tetrahymena thermophila SB210]|eukprot:XP_001027907.1 hypothetical protein TTHERM_00497180 [Tetrahymena thermophila SB210]